MVAASKLRHAIVVGSSEAEALQAVSKIETIHFGHDDMRAYYAERFPSACEKSGRSGIKIDTAQPTEIIIPHAPLNPTTATKTNVGNLVWKARFTPDRFLCDPASGFPNDCHPISEFLAIMNPESTQSDGMIHPTDRREFIRLAAAGAAWVSLQPWQLMAASGVDASDLSNPLNWQKFLARHDLVWERLPDSFESAAFTGNGKLGAMIFTDESGQSLKWQQGRSDVAFNTADAALKTMRIPIGDLVLKPVGKILSGEMRMNLWDAEVHGTIKTDKGEIEFQSITHSDLMVNVFAVTVRGDEKASWSWSPGLATNPRKLHRKEEITPDDRNPLPVRSREGDIEISYQPLNAAGGHATAWKIIEPSKGQSIVYTSIGFGKEENAAKVEAVAAVNQAVAIGLTTLTGSHRDWWHRFWPESFVSIPDTRLESFYYIQMYKMASGTRPGRPALDLMGPWFRNTPWPMIWWNLNLQLTYWPQLTGNRMELGESLVELIDHGAAALANNAGEFKADSAGVGRTSSYDCVGPVTEELCNLPWAMHNYWLHYRYCMDDQMLRERIFPLLKRAINYYLHYVEKGADGKLHITRGFSPEYPGQPTPNPDSNIDHSLLRWGCETLLASCERLKLDDPQIPQWKKTLENLIPYPQDENGLRISASTPFAKSHRHFSHLLMIYPLYVMTPEQPENRELVIKSLKHWMGMPSALMGYSFTGAASISALLGEGDEAARYLNLLLDFKKIHSNTFYTEAGPVIETPLAAAASLNDMLLSSWGDCIRVFPGVPHSWKEIRFHHLRAQGAFLVSARRDQGQTRWVRVKSLAGEPCRIRPGLEGEVRATTPLKSLGDGRYELTLGKNEEAILYCGIQPPLCEIDPVPATPGRSNFYGLKTPAAVRK